MDEKTLGEIEARAKAATPGPWVSFDVDREDVPALVAEVRRLREALAALQSDEFDGNRCFGTECFTYCSDCHSPDCVRANAALGRVVDGSSWAAEVARKEAEAKQWRERGGL